MSDESEEFELRIGNLLTNINRKRRELKNLLEEIDAYSSSQGYQNVKSAAENVQTAANNVQTALNSYNGSFAYKVTENSKSKVYVENDTVGHDAGTIDNEGSAIDGATRNKADPLTEKEAEEPSNKLATVKQLKSDLVPTQEAKEAAGPKYSAPGKGISFSVTGVKANITVCSISVSAINVAVTGTAISVDGAANMVLGYASKPCAGKTVSVIEEEKLDDTDFKVDTSKKVEAVVDTQKSLEEGEKESVNFETNVLKVN